MSFLANLQSIAESYRKLDFNSQIGTAGLSLVVITSAHTVHSFTMSRYPESVFGFLATGLSLGITYKVLTYHDSHKSENVTLKNELKETKEDLETLQNALETLQTDLSIDTFNENISEGLQFHNTKIAAAWGNFIVILNEKINSSDVSANRVQFSDDITVVSPSTPVTPRKKTALLTEKLDKLRDKYSTVT